jgi:AcrR family transcriptional regulator
MVDGALTAEAILVATEDVLRRYGPTKATVVDVARALGVSHGSVYRHFATKAALREAVTKRWLDRTHADLEKLADDDSPAPDRLRRWLTVLFEAKRRKALDDPELFATYSVLVGDSSTVVAAHFQLLVGHLTRIITDGRDNGLFAVDADRDDEATARAVFDATARFHDPAHASQWAAPDIEAAFRAVCALILAGLRP